VALSRFTEKLLLGDDDEGSCSSDSSSSSGQQAEPGPGPSARELARQRAEEAALLADLAAEKTIDDQEREGLSVDAAARERLQRLQRFAKAVRQHLPPRGADALPVVVVGAGPAGLLTAIEATRAGAAVTVLEKRSEYTRSVPRLQMLRFSNEGEKDLRFTVFSQRMRFKRNLFCFVLAGFFVDRDIWFDLVPERYNNAVSLKLLSEWGLGFLRAPSVKDEATGAKTASFYAIVYFK
jgi:hypothetical protein